jgi:hypothetical protein
MFLYIWIRNFIQEFFLLIVEVVFMEISESEYFFKASVDRLCWQNKFLRENNFLYLGFKKNFENPKRTHNNERYPSWKRS